MATNLFPTTPGSSYSLIKYPIDIVDNGRHGNNFAVFYINVRENSKTVRSNNKTVQNVNGTPRSAQGQFGLRVGGNQNVAGINKLRRTNIAICTHIPHNISVNHGMDYEQPELGLLGSLAAANGTPSLESLLYEAGKTFLDTSGALLSLAGAAIGGAAGNVAVQAGQNLPTDTATNIIKSVAGVTLNPHVEVLFKGVKHRTFKFTYEFFPKSPEESTQVRELINLFRFHMHPELLDAQGAARQFVFPSEFDVYFYHQDDVGLDAKENPWLFIISSCVLTNVKVNYTAVGQFSAHKEGQPVGISLELDFQELEVMTKERLTELEFRQFNSIPETIQSY